jgi:hypothetical protein
MGISMGYKLGSSIEKKNCLVINRTPIKKGAAFHSGATPPLKRL